MEAFDYVAPRSLSEAFAALGNGKRTLMLAGGTDVIVQLREGRKHCDQVIDLKHIPEMMALAFTPDGSLEIGAAVPLAQIYENPEVRAKFPALVDAASIIGGTAVQSRASLAANSVSEPRGIRHPRSSCSAHLHRSTPGRERSRWKEFLAGRGEHAPARRTAREHRIRPADRSAAYYHSFITRTKWTSRWQCGVRIELATYGSTIHGARVALARWPRPQSRCPRQWRPVGKPVARGVRCRRPGSRGGTTPSTNACVSPSANTSRKFSPSARSKGRSSVTGRPASPWQRCTSRLA